METATRRRPSAQRRPEIAKAALRIIGEHGRGALTTANLAAELGLSSGALFRHFASLDDVLREAVRVALIEIAVTFPDHSLPPLERLLALAGNRMRLIAADRGLGWLLRSDEPQLTLPDDASALLRSLAKSSQRFLLTALREGAEDGSIRRDVDPEILLLTVTGDGPRVGRNAGYSSENQRCARARCDGGAVRPRAAARTSKQEEIAPW